MTLNCIWWWGIHFWRSEECGLLPSLQLLSVPLNPRLVVPVRVRSMGQIDLFKITWYLIKWNKNILKIVTWSYNFFLLRIIISYLKPYNSVQTNDYHWIEINPWVECLPMVWKTRVQSQVKSYQRLKKWYLMPPCLTLSIIK